MEAKKPEEQWEIELDELLDKFLKHSMPDASPGKCLKAVVAIKNFVQKERIIAKLKENQAWSEYFKNKDIDMAHLSKVFDAMSLKYSNLLERF